MNIEENFQSNSKYLLFSDNKNIIEKRKELMEKIISNNFDKKNNESLKNVDISNLLSFDYNHKNDFILYHTPL